jgi:hypothetical protein
MSAITFHIGVVEVALWALDVLFGPMGRPDVVEDVCAPLGISRSVATKSTRETLIGAATDRISCFPDLEQIFGIKYRIICTESAFFITCNNYSATEFFFLVQFQRLQGLIIQAAGALKFLFSRVMNSADMIEDIM